jgi:transposase
MVRPELKKWKQTPEDLRRLAIESPHPRTRERFLALYMLASKQANATQWAQTIGREDESVINWVHKYNEGGPDAVVYRRSGGRTPFLVSRR